MATYGNKSSFDPQKGMVRVTFGGIQQLPEKELLAYFEDKQLSDGGPVEAIAEPGDGTFVLTFMNLDDAERVLCRNHIFEGVEMKVSDSVSGSNDWIKNDYESTAVKEPFSHLYDEISNTASLTELKVPFEDNDGDDNDDDNGDAGDDTKEIDVVVSKLRYLQKHHKNELKNIAKEVKLKLDMQNVRIVIQGKMQKVDSAVKTLNGLLNTIEEESFNINKPRVLDFLNSELGQEQLARIEAVTKTTLDVGEGLYACIGEKEISINVIHGDIAIQQADVLVDTVGPALKLSEGALSGQLLRAGGPELQTLCNMMYPNGIKYGDVAKTFGGRLQCMEIYHCCIPKWNGSNFKNLKDILFLCLNAADSSGHTSITLPALGTGHLKYPIDKVARLMVTEMKSLLDGLGCLENVTVVLNPGDTEIIKCFNAELQKRGDDLVAVKVTENEIGIGDMVVKIKQGDITAEDTDCIVNSADPDLKLTRGPLAKAINKACGLLLKVEVELKVAEMKKHGIIITTAPRLPTKWIIHADLQHFHGNIKEMVKACLKTAQQHDVTSMSFPPLGTGRGSVPVEQMCKVLISTLRKYEGRKSSLREIRVVIDKEDKHQLFLEKLRDVVAKIEKEKSWKRVVSGKSKVTRKSLDRNNPLESDGGKRVVSPSEKQASADYLVLCNVDGRTDEAEVNIYSPSAANRSRAFEEVQKLCDHHIIEKSFRNRKLATFSSSQMQQLKRSLKDMKMKITVHPATDKVEVEGFRDTVMGFPSYLFGIVDSILDHAST